MLISCEDSSEVTILVVDDGVRNNVFIGRDKEINQILEDLKSNKGTRHLIVGESGSGKSALLDELYRRLTGEVDQNNRPFVGV
jgi:ATP-dependent Clp protease ATP-binding subunit ClpA